MKFTKILLPAALAIAMVGTVAARDRDDFYGKVEQMPTAQSQEWVIGGKTFKTDDRTRIDHRKNDTIRVGSCVKVEGDLDRQGNFYISEIEQERDRKCER